MHRLADHVLAQHRSDRREAVAAARERGAPRALEVDIAGLPRGVDELAEQKRAPVAQSRYEAAELMPGIGLRDRSSTARHQISDQETETLRTPQPIRVETQFCGQRFVEHKQLRGGRRIGLPTDRHLRQLTGEAVLQRDGRFRCHTHLNQTTENPKGRKRRLPAARIGSMADDRRSRAALRRGASEDRKAVDELFS